MEVIDGEEVGGDGPREPALQDLGVQLAVCNRLGDIHPGGTGDLQQHPGLDFRKLNHKTFKGGLMEEQIKAQCRYTVAAI